MLTLTLDINLHTHLMLKRLPFFLGSMVTTDSVHQSTPVVQETRDVANSQVLTGCPITSTNNSEQENIPDNNDAQDEEDNDTQDEEDNDASGRHGNELKESDDNDPELMKELSKLLISMNAKMDESMATAMRMNASLEKYSNEPP